MLFFPAGLILTYKNDCFVPVGLILTCKKYLFEYFVDNVEKIDGMKWNEKFFARLSWLTCRLYWWLIFRQEKDAPIEFGKHVNEKTVNVKETV